MGQRERRTDRQTAEQAGRQTEADRQKSKKEKLHKREPV